MVLLIFIIFALALMASIASWVSASCALAVFFLAVLFLLVSLLFFILGAEFLGVLLLVIYAGAIILLFLFVVFLLNLRTVELYNDFRSYLPVGALIAFLLWATLCLVAQEIFLPESGAEVPSESPWQALFFGEHNLSLFGHVLYEHWGFFSILVAVLLLTVMCAVIFITLAIGQKPGARGPKKVAVDLAVVGRKLSVTLWSTRESPGVSQKKSSKGS